MTLAALSPAAISPQLALEVTTQPLLDHRGSQRASKEMRYGSRQTTQSLISVAMEFLDKNKIRELILTDLFLMVLPRTMIEGTLREKRAKFDAVREALIREILTTVAMVFMMPSIGYVFRKFYDASAWLNPKGLYTGAWVNTVILKRLQTLLNETVSSLPDKVEVTTLRNEFIERVLKQIQNGDQRLVNKLNALAPDLGIQPDLKALLPKMKTLFQPNMDPTQGVFPVEQVTDHLLKKHEQLSAALNPGRVEAEVLKQHHRSKLRLSENNALLKFDNAWMERLNTLLDEHQFGNTLKLPTNTNGAKGFARNELLLSVRNFTQQVVDRVAHDLTNGHLTQPVETYTFVQEAEQLSRQLLRSKLLLTWLPFGLALYFGRSLPVISNAITRALHGGQKYFPGDVALLETDSNLSKMGHHRSSHLKTPRAFDAFQSKAATTVNAAKRGKKQGHA